MTLILSWYRAEDVKNISASGVGVITETPDIANVQLSLTTAA